MGAVLRRLLDIPAPRRTRPSKSPDPPATNDGPGLAHQHRMRSANSRCSRSPPKDSIRCGWTAGASIVQKHSASGTSAYKHGIIVLAGVLPSRHLIEYNWV